MLIQCPARGWKIHSELDCVPNQNNPACIVCQSRRDLKKPWAVEAEADTGRGADRIAATRKKPPHKPSKLEHVKELQTFRAMAWAYLTLSFRDQRNERETLAWQELAKYFDWKLEKLIEEIIEKAEKGKSEKVKKSWVPLVAKALGADAYLEPWFIRGLAMLCAQGITVQIPGHRGEITDHLENLPEMLQAEERLERGQIYDKVFIKTQKTKYTRDLPKEKMTDEIHWLIGLNRQRYSQHLFEDYGMMPEETLTQVLNELGL